MELIDTLEKWYEEQCDGEWEHYNGISIQNLDNPGWMVTIDLDDTVLEDKSFEPVSSLKTDRDWIVCEVKEGKFFGNGGTRNLGSILQIFLNWALSENQSL